MGFASPNEDQAAANAEYLSALEKWASIFLASGTFICGNALSIAGEGHCRRLPAASVSTHTS